MGRNHIKLPSHLYLSPPPTPPSSNPSSSSVSAFLSAKSVGTFHSSAALFQDTSNSALAVRDKIPGFKTSAAFLTTLRANLILDIDSAPTSLTNTPDSLRPTNMTSSTGSLPPPSPSNLAQGVQDDDPTETPTIPLISNPSADIPPLTTIRVESEDDKVEALHLVADSVAQQRQFASRDVIFHPITLGTLVLIFGLLYQYFYKGEFSDWAIVGTTFVGVLMSTLISARWMGGGYLEEAERVGTWKWLDQGRSTDSEIVVVGDSDDILLTRYGDIAIGALIMRGVRDSQGPTRSNSTNSPSKKRKPQQYSLSATKNSPINGVIRGWTTKNRYRKRGIGTGLLEEAIKLCQERGWSGPEFADDHANGARILPRQFNGGVLSRERKARDMLDRIKDNAGIDSSTSNAISVSEKTSSGRKKK